MVRVALLVLSAAAIFGQVPPATPEKAPPQASLPVPPDVDAALRSRVTRFYQLETDGKFYQALQLVADDTKDSFIGSNKAIPRSFEIQSIRYSDDFTKAEVVMLVTRMLTLEGFMGHPLAMKVPSRWKLENGQWCFYVDPEKDRPASPFSRLMPPGMPLPAGGPPGAPRPLQPTGGNLTHLRALTVDRLSVQLKSSGPSEEQVAITNPSPWPAALTLADPAVAGLSVKLEPLALKPGQKAILSIRSSGDVPIPKLPFRIVVTVQQTKQTIPIQVSFAN